MKWFALVVLVLVVMGPCNAELVKLAERTSVRVVLSENLRSGQGKAKDEVRYELAEDIYGPNRELLARKGAPAFGHIIRTKKRGVFGRSGKLEFSCDYTNAIDGTKIMLRGSDAKSGKGNGGAVIATTLLLTPLALLVSGRDVEVKKGTEYVVYVDQDVVIDPAKDSATPTISTYTFAIKPSAMIDLAKQIVNTAKLTGESTVVMSWFELVPEKTGATVDPIVSRNACDDLARGLSGVVKMADKSEFTRIATGLQVDVSREMDLAAAKAIGATVKASHVLTGVISDRGAFVVVTLRAIEVVTGSMVEVTAEVQK